MKILITGGAGFIGSNIAKRLSSEHQVKIIDNLSSGNLSNIEEFKDKVEFVKGDIRDINFLNEEFKGFDAALHLAGIVGVPYSIKNPLETNEINVKGTLNVLMAAKNCGVKKVVFSSTCAVYGDNTNPKEDAKLNPNSPYAVSKLLAEHYCKLFSELYGVKTVILRYFNVYGKNQRPDSNYGAVIPNFVKALSEEVQPIIYGDGGQTRDFVHVEDVVDANILALSYEEENNEVFNIGFGNKFSIIGLLDVLNKIHQKNLEPVFKENRSKEIRDSHADISKSKDKLKYSPKDDLEKGLRFMLGKK